MDNVWKKISSELQHDDCASIINKLLQMQTVLVKTSNYAKIGYIHVLIFLHRNKKKSTRLLSLDVESILIDLIVCFF